MMAEKTLPESRVGLRRVVLGNSSLRSDTGQQSKDELVFTFLGIKRDKINVSTEVASIQSLDSN